MDRIRISQNLIVFFMIAGLIGIFPPAAAPLMAQEEKSQSLSVGVESPSTSGKENGPQLETTTLKNQKQIIVAGVPFGVQRSEIIKLLLEKSISPLQRTALADIFPRLIKEISHLQKAYLYYTDDRLSKINMLFNVPLDPKTMTGEPIFDYYGELRKGLVRTFGQPTNTSAHIHPNFRYRLVALETGNAYFFDYWENVSEMKVLLSLKGGEGKIEFSLTYQYLPLFE